MPCTGPAGIATAVIGIGNPILGDDSIGLEVIDRLAPILDARHLPVRLQRCYAVGIDLIELLDSCDAALLVEGVMTDTAPPGFCHMVDLSGLSHCLPRSRLACSHGVGLAELLALGNQLGYRMPTAVRILGIEIERMVDFSPQPTVAIRKKLCEVVDVVVNELYNLISSVPH